MRNFRTYDLAISFYRATEHIELPGHLRSQLLRAASSVVLNLGEGYGKFSKPDQRRFYQIAFGSIRECQAIFDIVATAPTAARLMLDHLAASAFRLLKGR